MLFILPEKHFFVLVKFQIFAQSTFPFFSFVGYRWIHRISPFKISRSGATSQIAPFLRECFFPPLWRTIKNTSRVKSG